MSFTIDDLMTLLVTRVGLPESARTEDPTRTFHDVGLDSLAFLQLRAELQTAYAVELPEGEHHTFGDIVAAVNGRPAAEVAR